MHYRIPIDFNGFFQRIEMSYNRKQAHFEPVFDKGDRMKDSIDEFLDLLIFTHPSECVFFHDFGFMFWDYQFNNISIEQFNNSEHPRKEFEANLVNAINTYETRLDNVNVEMFLTDQDSASSLNKSVYSIVIKVSGRTKSVPAESYYRTIVFSSESMKRR